MAQMVVVVAAAPATAPATAAAVKRGYSSHAVDFETQDGVVCTAAIDPA